MSAVRRPATMPDVARLAGVSVSTVSRTLRGLPSVSPETRQRVEQAARELSFTISRSASSLVTGKTQRVAVMVWNVRSWFVGAVLTGVSSGLRAAGLDLLVYNVTNMAERTAFFEQLPARRNADALLVVSFDLTEEERGRLDELGMPLIFVSQCIAGRPSVHIDDVEGARQAMRHLVNLGHRRIAFAQPYDDRGFSFSARKRAEGYREVLGASGIPFDEDLFIRGGPRYFSSGGQAAAHILSLPDPPTALFAENDKIAIGALRVLKTSRVAVPESISVLGFDDQTMAELFDLTTVAQPAVDLGRKAVELTCSIMDGQDRGTEHIVLPTRLVPRATTAPPRAAERDGAAFEVPPTPGTGAGRSTTGESAEGTEGPDAEGRRTGTGTGTGTGAAADNGHGNGHRH